MLKKSAAEQAQRILALYAHDASQNYRSAEWLMSEFDSDVWTIDLESRITVDWRVHLDDGHLLTSPRHRDTLTSLRCWLISQTHPDSTGGKVLTLNTTQNMLYRCLHCIDYFLLRADSFKLAKHGLTGLTNNDIKATFIDICSESSISRSVYRWPAALSQFLRGKLNDVTPREGPSYLEDALVPEEADRALTLEASEIRTARRWLHFNGFYKSGIDDHRRVTNNGKLAKLIYPNTVWAASAVFPKIPELCIDAGTHYRREYIRAPVASTEDRRMAWRSASRYGAVLRSLRLLAISGIPGPTFDTRVLDVALKSMNLKDNMRFRSLPYESVMKPLRQAIEYFLDHGDSIVDSYLEVCERAQRDSLSSWKAFDALKREAKIGSSAFSDFGSWTIVKNRYSKECYFKRLRADPGLVERVTILVGAMRFTLGALTARRSSEVSSLAAGSTLDASQTRIVFRNRKSGVREWRQRIARPIPPIATRMINLLERMHQGLVKLGAADQGMRLFSTPWTYGRPALAFNSSECLDVFCDWAQTDLDKEGRRYYIRHHQLRRFFATLFFYGDGFGGLDTLRWFLGHLDAQHVWNYITENVPGAAIRSVAADFATYQVKHKTQEAEKLNDLLTHEFGVTDFATIDDESLSNFIHSLIEENTVSVEPQFLDLGRHYRMAIVLTGEAL